MGLEQKIEELAAALVENTSILKQLVAGQKAAIEVVKQGNPATATRGRKPKGTDTPNTETTPNTSDEPADTASGAEDVASASEGNSAGAAESASTTETPAASKSDAPAAEKITFGVAAKKWMDKEEKGSDAYKARGAKVVGILAHFGAGKMSELKDEDDAKALFFLKRTVKGLPVNFDAAYDFDGPFDQEEPVATEAAASDDDDDMFG